MGGEVEGGKEMGMEGMRHEWKGREREVKKD